jgi:hypothetical protein
MERIIAWIGKAFMNGSGYEQRLHEELILMRKEIQMTNQLLVDISWVLVAKEVEQNYSKFN